ncbi:MAG: hypothetical protein NC131_19790 [Roseburia sp.]|nr:hypothetical protein [Roseburia sp.]
MNEDSSDLHSGISVAITLALVALVFSVAAVANLCPRTQHDFDYLGLLVGILGLIVTVLLG